MKHYIPIALVLISFLTLPVHADEDVLDYEGILKELSRSSSETEPPEGDAWDDVMIHTGFGFTNTYVNIETREAGQDTGLLSGFEASLGIDLFSRNWLSEGTVRVFSGDRLSERSQASLNEFDLKLIYRAGVSRYLEFRAGLGVAARYLKYRHSAIATNIEQTTPSWIALTGIQVPLARRLSVGAELAMRSPMIADTIDQTAIDGGMNFSVQF